MRPGCCAFTERITSSKGRAWPFEIACCASSYSLRVICPLPGKLDCWQDPDPLEPLLLVAVVGRDGPAGSGPDGAVGALAAVGAEGAVGELTALGAEAGVGALTGLGAEGGVGSLAEDGSEGLVAARAVLSSKKLGAT